MYQNHVLLIESCHVHLRVTYQNLMYYVRSYIETRSVSIQRAATETGTINSLSNPFNSIIFNAYQQIISSGTLLEGWEDENYV